ncbi:hypothetical protein HPS_0457 [Glaesserella parasuis 29755]|nr:hypothetical protein HPSNAG_0494 [Glaesserella parasuis str. Nagasaki]EQA13875.1 hypothetical protein HPSSW140_0354 [Glaesserella parasuis SW140]EQA96035.1 hypothetical protein HPS_0457 [Glaesserella parasuis 29755]
MLVVILSLWIECNTSGEECITKSKRLPKEIICDGANILGFEK